MDIPFEIIRSLRILGLSSGATASEIRSAFRGLARVCHPDVAGKQAARRFEQITGAYAFLKGLTQEELEGAAPEFSPPGRGVEARGNFSKKSNKHAAKGQNTEKTEEKKREKKEREEREREARKAAKGRAEAAFNTRAEAALRRGERAVALLLRSAELRARECRAQDFILRLGGESVEVRHLALSRLGVHVNRDRVFDAVTDLLSRREIDEKTARLTVALPLTPGNRKKMAEILAERASEMPDFLLLFLLQLRTPGAVSRELLERYIRSAGAGGAALILRYWPEDSFLSDTSLRALMSKDDEELLLPLFGVMKQRNISCPSWGYERLKKLLSHSSAGVRVWAKALLPGGSA